MILLSHRSPDADILVRVELILPTLWVFRALVTPRKELCVVGVAECGTELLGPHIFGVVLKRTLNSSLSAYSTSLPSLRLRE